MQRIFSPFKSDGALISLSFCTQLTESALRKCKACNACSVHIVDQGLTEIAVYDLTCLCQIAKMNGRSSAPFAGT